MNRDIQIEKAKRKAKKFVPMETGRVKGSSVLRCTVKRLGVFLLPQDGILVHHKQTQTQLNVRDCDFRGGSPIIRGL